MLTYLNADLYRIRKEKLSVITFVVIIAMTLLSSYLNLESSIRNVADTMTVIISLFMLNAAKIFFGDDYSNRTINNSLINSKNRLYLFTYKWLAMMGLGLSYILVSYLVIIIYRLIFLGTVDFQALEQSFSYQLPFYLAAQSICGFLISIFKKMYQTYLIYILWSIVFESLLLQLSVFLFETDFLSPYLIFTQLALTGIIYKFPVEAGLIALVYIVVLALATYFIFSKREFK